MNHTFARRRSVAAAYFLIAVSGGGLIVSGSESALEGRPRGVHAREVVLDNGLQLLLVERHEQPTVAAGVFYGVGGVNDPAGKSGIAHLFEHMLFKGSRIIGTSDYQAERPLIERQDALRAEMIAAMGEMRLMKRRGEIEDVLETAQWTPLYTALQKEYDELIEAQRAYIKNNELFNLYSTNGGAGLNAGTIEDATIYFVQLPANKIELFFWLESDRMTNGVMREFYIERKNVREERRLRVESTPTGQHREAFNAMFWQAHPYGTPVIGWPSEVESITRDDVRDFYAIHYAPNNATVVLVGDFKADDMVTMAERYFGRIPPAAKPPPPIITEEPRPRGERRFHAEADTNPLVRIRYLTVAMGHKDEAALDVRSALLSGKAGRLYKRLVTQEEAALGEPSASHEARKYAGYFEIGATAKENRTPEELEQFLLEEIDKLRDAEVSDHELQRVKNQVLAYSVRRLKRNTGLMFQLGLAETWIGWRYLNEAPQRMLATTAADVRRVIREYLDPKTRTVAIYRTKAAPEPAPDLDPLQYEDPELVALLERLPRKIRKVIRRRVEEIAGMDDRSAVGAQASILSQALQTRPVSEEQRPAFEYLLKKYRERYVVLEAAEAAKEGRRDNQE